MKKLFAALLSVSITAVSFYSLGAADSFQTLDKITSDDSSVTMTLSGESKYHAFKITNPPRIVVEFTNTEFNSKDKEITGTGELVKRIRGGQFQNDPVRIARVVVDLKKMVDYHVKRDGNTVNLVFTPKTDNTINNSQSPVSGFPVPAPETKPVDNSTSQSTVEVSTPAPVAAKTEETPAPQPEVTASVAKPEETPAAPKAEETANVAKPEVAPAPAPEDAAKLVKPAHSLDSITVDDNGVSITLSDKTKYHSFKKLNPPRIIVEFSNTEYNAAEKDFAGNGNIIKQVRGEQFQRTPSKIARVVLGLTEMVNYQISRDGNTIRLTYARKKDDNAAAAQTPPAAPADTTASQTAVESPAPAPAAAKPEETPAPAPETTATAAKPEETPPVPKAEETANAAKPEVTPAPAPEEAAKIVKPVHSLDSITVEDNGVSVALSGKAKYHSFKKTNPPRIIVEFSNTEYNAAEKEFAGNGNIIKQVRGEQFQRDPSKIARIVLGLTKMVNYQINRDGNTIRLTYARKKDNNAAAAQTPPAAPADTTASQTVVEAPAPAPTAAKPEEAAAPTPETTTTAAKPEETQALPKTQEPANLGKAEEAPALPKPEVTAQIAKPDETPIPPKPAETVKPSRPEEAPIVIAQPVNEKESTDFNLTSPKAFKASTEKEKPLVDVKAESKSMAHSDTAKNKKDYKKIVSPPVTQSQLNQHVSMPKKLITIDFDDADIREVFRILSMKSGINIIYGNDVTGTITLRLENVPFDRAFQTILSLKNLVSQELGNNIIRVASPAQITLERAHAVTFTRVFPLNYAKADDIKQNLDSVRNAEGRQGTISVDLRTNSLVITDTPDGLISLEKIINELDSKPVQVLIEAKIVEVVLNNDFDLGIQWQSAQTIQNTANTQVGVGQSQAATQSTAYGAAATIGATVVSPLTVSNGGTGAFFPATPANGEIGQIAFGIISNQSNITGVLSALAQKSLSKLLSNPKITTINNKEAKILVGQRIPYTTTTVTTAGSTQSTNFLDVGVKLTVTPTINADRKITLAVHPEVSLYVRADPAGPVIGTREAQTTVIVNSGETVVIGGLITEQDMKQGEGVPLLQDLPVIGFLFKHTLKTKERDELLVFLTPEIID